jgi:Uma2 family endonuclease
MSEPYEEILEGETLLRIPPAARHETICARLHERVASSMAGVTVAKLLSARTAIELPHGTRVCPDLALLTAATNKLWLAAEVISSEDHHADTVIKKTIYEEIRLPRLWMVDPRYNNVEIYHGGEHGLALKHILALQEVLNESALPGFQYNIAELFQQ